MIFSHMKLKFWSQRTLKYEFGSIWPKLVLAKVGHSWEEGWRPRRVGATISPSQFAFFLISLGVFVELWLRRVWASLGSFSVSRQGLTERPQETARKRPHRRPPAREGGTFPRPKLGLERSAHKGVNVLRPGGREWPTESSKAPEEHTTVEEHWRRNQKYRKQ